MSLLKQQGGFAIVLTIVVALLLTELPLPAIIAPYQPEWLILVLIYWAMALPQRVGVGVAWFSGLLLDVLRDTLLGQYALAFALTIFIVLRLYQRIRNFPIRQQIISIFILMLIHTSFVVWIKALAGTDAQISMVIIPALISSVFWPFIYFVLRNIRRANYIT